MDARQYDLPVACLCHAGDLPDDVFRSAAADSTPCIGDDTVGAELVTAILNLDIGTGMLRGMLQSHFLVFRGMIDVNDSGVMQGLVHAVSGSFPVLRHRILLLQIL